MKPLNLKEELSSALSEESRQASLDVAILSQIKILERFLETNISHVQDPGAYNVCAGLIDQLKFYSCAAFRTPEANLLNGVQTSHELRTV